MFMRSRLLVQLLALVMERKFFLIIAGSYDVVCLASICIIVWAPIEENLDFF